LGIRKSPVKINEKKYISGEVKSCVPTRMGWKQDWQHT